MAVGSNVTLLVMDPQQAYHWIEVMGLVVEIRDEAHGARDHINSLAEKYTGSPVYQGYRSSNVDRLMYIVEPDAVHGR